MITPIIWDFKRSFLRLSTLIFIVIFILGGIGLSYLVYSMFAQQYSSIGTAGIIIHTNNTTILRGIIYDVNGNIVNRAHLAFYKKGVEIAGYDVTGDYRINASNLWVERPSIVSIKSGLSVRNYSIQWITIPGANVSSYGIFGELSSGILSGGSVITSAPGRRGEGAQAGSLIHYERLVVISKRTGRSFLIVLAFNISNPVNPEPNATVYYSYASYKFQIAGWKPSTAFSKLRFRELGRLRDYVAIYRISIDPNKDLLVLRYDYGKQPDYSVINYGAIMPTEALTTGIVTGSQGLRLFAEFFPILFIYLAYVLLAKPKTTGALEFILARPVTRWDVYLVRWLAGILTGIVAVGLFVLSLDAGLAVFMGVSLSAGSLTAAFLGLTAALASFYTLSYFLAAWLKSGGYLASSILLYLLFSLFWGLVALLAAFITGTGISGLFDLTYKLALLNPLGAYNLASYFIEYDYGLVHKLPWLNPGVAALQPIVWITVFFLLGYLVFKKTDLSR